MSPRLRQEPFGADHERARELAAARFADPLDAAEADWLAAHLAWCSTCRAVANEYESQRIALRALRLDAPTPPRDMWARTAAALEADGRRRRSRRWLRLDRIPTAPLAGLLVLAVIVGGSLLRGLTPRGDSTTKGPEGPDPTPIAVTAADVQVLVRGADGSLKLKTTHYDAVCPVGESSCGTTPSADSQALAQVSSSTDMDGVLSPSSSRLVVLGANKVYVVQVGPEPSEGPGGSPLRSATPTPTPTPTITALTTSEPTAAVTSPSAASASPSEPPASDDTSASATASVVVDASPTAPVVTSSPPAISATPGSTPTATPMPASPTASVAVTAAPDGAIEIAKDVVVIGSTAAYSADGSAFAFTARSTTAGTGPDVYLWRTAEGQAHPVTTDHRSVFASWLGDRLLVSRTEGASTAVKPVTFVLDPATGHERAVTGTMWRPSVDGQERTAVWWDGSVRDANDGSGLRPERGRLVLGAWPEGHGSGIATQVLTSDAVKDWQVRWDESGSVLALWVAGSNGVGRLSLFSVDPGDGSVDLAKPMLEDQPALEGFSLHTGRLAWAAPTDTGDTALEVLDWSGQNVGQIRMPTESGATVVH